MDIKSIGLAAIVTTLVFSTGCLKKGTTKDDSQASSRAPAATVKPIIGELAPGSKFSKIKVGMPMKQVYDLIGDPTDTKSYVTGKAFIPFYFGSDAARFEALYKGWGRLVFTGANAFGGRSYKLYQIIHDKNEDGYNN